MQRRTFMGMSIHIREVSRIVTAHRQLEGAGFIVRRPLPTTGIRQVDPFLLIDEAGPMDFGPGEAVGAPDHPHRGFETVSYILEGAIEHEDSAGHRGTLRPGDVQWMTAGGGIVHSETPSPALKREGGRMHGFQVWVNLPARIKMTAPRYQEIAAARIPEATSADGRARVKVIAGEALGVRAVIETHTPIVYQDWSLDGGADVQVAIPSDHNALVYVFEGEAQVGDAASVVHEGQMGVLAAGDRVRLRAAEGEGARLLLLAGRPHGEPVVSYGPFVMNTEQEIAQAIADFRSGRMGEITRSARVG
jgi:quercetin 2,3-dioxygenase